MKNIKNAIYCYVANHLLRQPSRTSPWGQFDDELCEEDFINQKIRLGLFQWVQEKRYRDNNVNIDEIAHTLHVETSQLAHFFNTQMRTRFTTWRKNLRIYDAKELLIKRPDLPIVAIGQIVGFEDKSNFRRAFRQVCHCSPQEWRESKI